MAAVTRMVPSKPNRKKDATRYSVSVRRRGQHYGQKASVLLFLTMAVFLSFSLTLGEIEQNIGSDSEKYTSKDETRLDGNVSTRRATATTTTKINIIDPPHNLLELLSSPSSNNKVQNRIWIVLAYRDNCEYSEQLLRKLVNEAIPRIQFKHFDSDDDRKFHPPEMNFVPMSVDDKEVGVELKLQFLNRIGIARLPSIFFLRDEEQKLENNVLLENAFATAEVYRGRSESISDLVDGLYHYLSRLQFRPWSPLKNQEDHSFGDRSSPLSTVRVGSLRELQNIIRNADDFKILQSPPVPLDPDLSAHDEQWIRYLMDDNSGTANCIDTGNLEKQEGTFGEIGDCLQRGSTIQNPYRVIIQCRNFMGEEAPHSILQLYQEYDQAAKILGTRRDVIFSILEPHSDGGSSELAPFCSAPNDDGLVRVWSFYSNESLAEVDFDEGGKNQFAEENLNNSTSMINQLSSLLLPEVLWFDRRMTAPIAFHPRYRRHAVLFVDFHDPTSATESRDAIRLFRQECRQHQTEQQRKTNRSIGKTTASANDDSTFVCLVVPSTEIRVLNTFGIDMWSDLDRQATEKLRTTLCNSHNWKGDDVPDYDFCDNLEGEKDSKLSGGSASEISSVLPAMLFTDRQIDGATRRHYLDPPINSISLSGFINDFINGRIKPEVKSGHIGADYHNATGRTSEFPTNKHFINLLTANSIPLFLESNRDKHVLVELYAPTCGHCKRFNIIWNSLGTLIEFLGWSDKLLLARIDVSSNEIIVPGMATSWLPDLFYFGVGVTENPIHYHKTPFADDAELGSISDPLELLEWWMDEAAGVINEAELLLDLEKVIAGTS